jgi:hypothetical protein
MVEELQARLVRQRPIALVLGSVRFANRQTVFDGPFVLQARVAFEGASPQPFPR